MKDYAVFFTGADIPFRSGFIIHQPSITEVSMIGDYNYAIALKTLSMDKNNVDGEFDGTDFDLIMAIINSKQGRDNKKALLMLLTILFPDYSVSIEPAQIKLSQIIADGSSMDFYISNENFSDWYEIVTDIFYVTEEESLKFNVKGKQAERIAEKIKNGIKERARRSNKDTELDIVDLFGRKISIVSVGMHINMNDLCNTYTIFQLNDCYKRYCDKVDFDIYFKQRLAGAKELDKVDFWHKEYYQQN